MTDYYCVYFGGNRIEDCILTLKRHSYALAKEVIAEEKNIDPNIIKLIEVNEEEVTEFKRVMDNLKEKQRGKINNVLKVCADCGSKDVYSVEFRTDYAGPRIATRINPNIKELNDDDIPYRLGGYYCNTCKQLVSIKKCVNNESL